MHHHCYIVIVIGLWYGDLIHSAKKLFQIYKMIDTIMEFSMVYRSQETSTIYILFSLSHTIRRIGKNVWGRSFNMNIMLSLIYCISWFHISYNLWMTCQLIGKWSKPSCGIKHSPVIKISGSPTLIKMLYINMINLVKRNDLENWLHRPDGEKRTRRQ